MLALIGAESNFRLKLGSPVNRASTICDNISSSGKGAFPKFQVFAMPHAGEIGIDKHVQFKIVSRLQNKAFITHCKEVTPDALDSKLVDSSGVRRIPSTLMNSEGYVWSSILSDII